MISKGLLNFKNNIDVLKSDVYLFSEDKISLEKLKKTLKLTYNSYKEIEFYIAYHYPEYAKTNLNAAPLFRLEAAY
ncbi:hypothetical protein [Kaistella jeonii]|nr:hypothetical protein [Kaistella jeonii]